MPELYADFVRDGGTYMILKAQEGLRSEQLNRVQRAMLATVSIPSLLRLDIREVDFEVSLHYDITGKRMLSHCLKSDKIGMPEFYSLLLQVVSMLEDCKRYMLSPANFLLDEQHIFVEESLSCGIFHFTYVPWKEALSAVPLSQTLLALITRLLTCVSRVEGDGIQQIIRFCDGELFSLAELKKLLFNLLSGDQAGEQEQASTNTNSPESSRSVVKEYLPADYPNGYGTVHSGEAEAELGPGQEHWPGMEEEVKSKASIKPLYFILGAILADAACWKFLYLDRPGAVGLYISLSVTVLLALAVYLVWRKNISVAGFEMEPGELESSAALEGITADTVLEPTLPNHSAAAGLREPIGDNAFYSSPSMAASLPESPPPQPELPSWESVQEIPASPATVLLSRSMLPGQEGAGRSNSLRYFLERHNSAGGVPERIPMLPGSFVIGRSAEIVKYVETTAGVSRAHVEVMVASKGCSIKDLGSRNGTRLRGELIAPYKEYPLEPGDVFALADASFKLGMEPFLPPHP